MTALYLYDDRQARSFEPFALTRPVCELRAGMELIRRRWELALGLRAEGTITGAHLRDFVEPDAVPWVEGRLPAGSVIANSRCVAPLAWRERDADVWMCEGQVAAVRLGRDLEVRALADGDAPLETLGAGGTRSTAVPGRWLDEVWTLITTLLDQLREDITAVGPQVAGTPLPHAAIVGAHPVLVERGANLEPLVCLDATAGPVLVRTGASVRAFTRLVGPCYIAPGATVLADRVHGCSIGEGSVVRGELSETVVLGYANKSHDGFVGHSYLGRWVNLGAGTITSNLKNSYGPVAMWTPAGMRDTGALKLGTLFGDHVKTGIGMRLTTGSVVGAGSNIYGSGVAPKYVPPFSWGEPGSLSEFRVDKFLEIAERAMGRRQIALSERSRRQLAAAHRRSSEARQERSR